MSPIASSSPELPVVLFETTRAWEAWLTKHGKTSKGLMMRLAKKDKELRSISYMEALDVALCHGWIDGVKKSYDADSWLQKFTPRGARSVWSSNNKDKVLQLVEAGMMRPEGLATVERAKANGQWDKAYAPASKITIPPDLEAALKKNKKARAFFEKLTGSDRYAILYRLHHAKRPETRAKRLNDFMGMLERGEVLHPKN